MLYLSEVLLRHHELNSFEQLVEVIKEEAKRGVIHFKIDVKPSFADTPTNWEDRLEAAFT